MHMYTMPYIIHTVFQTFDLLLHASWGSIFIICSLSGPAFLQYDGTMHWKDLINYHAKICNSILPSSKTSSYMFGIDILQYVFCLFVNYSVFSHRLMLSVSQLEKVSNHINDIRKYDKTIWKLNWKESSCIRKVGFITEDLMIQGSLQWHFQFHLACYDSWVYSLNNVIFLGSPRLWEIEKFDRMGFSFNFRMMDFLSGVYWHLI